MHAKHKVSIYFILNIIRVIIYIGSNVMTNVKVSNMTCIVIELTFKDDPDLVCNPSNCSSS